MPIDLTEDMEIRLSRCFVIAERPRFGPALWRVRGRYQLVEQQLALDMARRELRRRQLAAEGAIEETVGRK